MTCANCEKLQKYIDRITNLAKDVDGVKILTSVVVMHSMYDELLEANARLRVKLKELEEYKFKYEGLCK